MTAPSDTTLEALAVQEDAEAKAAASRAATIRSWKAGSTPPTPPVTPPSTGTLTDLPNFKLIRSQSFDTPAAEGKFLSVYKDMGAYGTGWPDTSKNGQYDTSRLSVVNGALRIAVDTRKPGGSGPSRPGGAVPYFHGDNGADQLDQLYGRYQVTVRADSVKNYKIAFLLWPQSDEWDDGEIDFAEADLTGGVEAFNHYPGDPENQDEFSYGTKLVDSHTYACQWTPGLVEFFVDGVSKGRSTKAPTKPMHAVLQVETGLSGVKPSATDKGAVYVDQFAIWSYTGK